jgi:hypothetical protein
MAVSRSDRSRSSKDSVTEKVFWDEIAELRKQIRLLKPQSSRAPQITSHPADRTLSVGGTATFNVTAVGQNPLAYQWYHDGAAIQGETLAKLVLTDVDASDEGEYWCVVSNGVGEATSNRATLSTAVVNDSFPIGGIALWSGTLATIPTNYALCDGTNGTPNMLDRFILGVRTSATNPGSTGGTIRHIHSISTADVAANKALGATATIGGNTGATAPGASSGNTAPGASSGNASPGGSTDGHSTVDVFSGVGTTVLSGPTGGHSVSVDAHNHSVTVDAHSHSVAVDSHTHSLPATTGSHEHALEGQTTTDRKTDNTAFADDHAALPPWYEAAYIQRVS